MRVIVTGGNGYLGTMLVRALTRKGELADRSGVPREIKEIVILGRSSGGQADKSSGVLVRRVTGSVGDAALLGKLFLEGPVSAFHLAAVLTGVTERDVDAAIDVNAIGTRNVLKAMADAEADGRFVMTSSETVYSRNPSGVPICDDTVVRPQTIYGISKAMAEHVVAAYCRSGRVDGRIARLSTVVVRPRKIGASAGASISDVLRDVSLGRECGVLLDPATEAAVIDYQSCISGLLRLHDAPGDAVKGDPMVNFPALTCTVAQMIAAAEATARRHGREPGRTVLVPNAFAQSTIDTWPTSVDGTRAATMGVTASQSLDEICEAFLEDYHSFWSDWLQQQQQA